MPSLRERVEEIPALVWTFIEQFSKAFRKPVTSTAKEDMAALQRYSWPGNVRELRNLIERAMIVTNGTRLTIYVQAPRTLAGQKSLKLFDVEATHIRSVLDITGWRVRGVGGAAELLVAPETGAQPAAHRGLPLHPELDPGEQGRSR